MELYAWYCGCVMRTLHTDQQRESQAQIAGRIYGVSVDEQRRYWDARRARESDRR